MNYDLEGTGDWGPYAEAAEFALQLARDQNREVVVKWTDWVKPYHARGELVPVHYFKFNPAMTEIHIRAQYLNVELMPEFRPVWPVAKE